MAPNLALIHTCMLGIVYWIVKFLSINGMYLYGFLACAISVHLVPAECGFSSALTIDFTVKFF